MSKNIKIALGVLAGFFVLVLAYLTVSSSFLKQGTLGSSSVMNDAGLSSGTMPMNAPTTFGTGGGVLPGAMRKSSEASPELSQEVVSDDSSVSYDQDKKVIKNGNLTLNVSNADRAAEDISKIAKDNGGDVFSSNFYKNSKNFKSGTITVKVPVKNFEKTFSEIKKVASVVVREGTSGQDVTEAYQDLETRIKNKQAEEEAYKKILETAQKVDDILSITRQLSLVRGEIESFQGQLKYMASQTDMATIIVSLSEDSGITITDSWRPLQVAKDALNSLIQKSQGFVNFVIVLLITVIPVALLYLLLGWIVYAVGKKVYVRFRKKDQV